MRTVVQKAGVGNRVRTKPRGLVALAGELAGTGLDLAHNTVQLAACEGRTILRRLALRAGLFLGGILFACMGLLLVLGGMALLLEEAAGVPMWLAVTLVGVVALGGGAAVGREMLHRLGDRDLAFPETLAELQADVEAFRREPGHEDPPRDGSRDGAANGHP